MISSKERLFEDLKHQYDEKRKLEESWVKVAKQAVTNGKAFAGVWMGTTNLYLVTEEHLNKISSPESAENQIDDSKA